MNVQLGRRVFDAGELPIIATAGTRDLASTPDVVMSGVERAVAAGADAVEIVEIDERADEFAAAWVAGLVATIRSRYPQVAIGVRAVGSRTAEVAADAGVDLLSVSHDGVYSRLAEIAAVAGTSLVVPSSELAERAVAAGARREGVLVEVMADGPASLGTATRRLPDLVHDGWPTLVTLSDGQHLAEALTAAAICAWLGARVFRTDRVPQIRQALDMAATLRGSRAPALGRRGLA